MHWTVRSTAIGPTRVGLALTVVAIAVVGLLGTTTHGAAAADAPVQTLVVDETHSIAGVMRLQAFARGLTETGLYQLQGVSALSVEAPPPDPPYELIFVIPAEIHQVWILTADQPRELTPRLRRAHERAKAIAARVYSERSERPRAVVDVSEDMLAAYYGRLFETNGWLRGR